MTDREIANLIWIKAKGKKIPKDYTDDDCRIIIFRYWHRIPDG